MRLLFVLIVAAILIALSIRRIPANERGVIYRLGRKKNFVVGPGSVLVIPFVDRLERISVEPFSVSLRHNLQSQKMKFRFNFKPRLMQWFVNLCLPQRFVIGAFI